MLTQEKVKEICNINLHKNHADSYGQDHREHYLDQYRILITAVNQITRIKQETNRYFLTIQTILVTAVGISLSRGEYFNPEVWHVIVPIVGVALSFIWWLRIRKYKYITLAKFSMLRCVEENLPLALYTTEAEILTSAKQNPYRSPGPLDPAVPWIFGFLYIFIFLFVG